MKIKFVIPTPDDSGDTQTTSFLVNLSIPKDRLENRYRTKPNIFGEHVFTVSRPTISTRVKVDPLHERIAKTIDTVLIPKKQIRGYQQLFATRQDNWNMLISFRYSGGDSIILIRRKRTAFYIDNTKVSRTRLITILAQVIYRSLHTRDTEIMDKYIERCIQLPYYVSYALENRTPYYFYYKGRKQEVRINTKLISETEAALEISEGIWASIPIKDLNIFIDTYLTGTSRSKTWYKISPNRLWTKLLGREPKESEYHLMIEWLRQNRTDAMVQKRAFDLLNQLCEEYDEFSLIKFGNKKSIYIKGKQADWVIVPRDSRRAGHQNVDTYCFERYQTWYKEYLDSGKRQSINDYPNDMDTELRESNAKVWRGPICIDNLHSNSSIGDQMAARAMLLKNDVIASQLVHTLKGMPFDTFERLRTPLVAWEEKEEQ